MAAVADTTGDGMNQRREVVEISRMERNTMLHKISILFRRECTRFVRLAVAALFAVTLGCSSAPSFAQEAGQQTFYLR
jgi:hypothetical protein